MDGYETVGQKWIFFWSILLKDTEKGFFAE